GSALPDRTEAELWILYGDMFRTLARWDDALKSFDRARSAISDPDSPVHLSAMLHEARTRSARGEADAAIGIYRAVLVHEPRLRRTPETVQARLRLARRLAVKGSIEETQALLAPLLQREAEIAALEKGEWLLAQVKTAWESSATMNPMALRAALHSTARRW